MPDIEANKRTVTAFYDLMFNQCRPAEAVERHVGDVYVQHNPMVADGKETWAHYGITPTWTTLAGYFKEFERRGSAINLGTFVGAGGVRNLVIGKDDRAATRASAMISSVEA